MRINITINDDTIRRDVKEAVDNYKEDFDFSFPSADAEEEFIEDCAESVIDKYEMYETYTPNYDDVVSDMLKIYGY